MRLRSSISAAVVGGMLGLLLGCSESNRNPAPVEILVTSELQTEVISLQSPPITGTGVADINVQAKIKNTSTTTPTDERFLDVKITAYRVSYIRTDGGRTVPAPFIVSSSQVISPGSTASLLNSFIAFQPGAFSQAPFAALLPQNGGVDPETGLKKIRMDVKVEVFGETLSGQRVYNSTRFPLEFCYTC